MMNEHFKNYKSQIITWNSNNLQIKAVCLYIFVVPGSDIPVEMYNPNKN